MVKGMGSFIGMSVLLLAVGYMAGYIQGSVLLRPTYYTLVRAMEAFWWASGALFVAGIVYRAILDRISAVLGILFSLAIAIALVLTGFYYGLK